MVSAWLLQRLSSRRVVLNRFDGRERAGAFGDLGTLLPYLIAYVAVVMIDPADMLPVFGAAQIASGWFYRTPFPVQPMKASGAIATQPAGNGTAVTPDMVGTAGLITGFVWLTLADSGVIQRFP